MERYKADLQRLALNGDLLMNSMFLSTDRAGFEKQLKAASMTPPQIKEFIEKTPNFGPAYEAWYSESLVLLRQLYQIELQIS